jgi:hypothetical protein
MNAEKTIEIMNLLSGAFPEFKITDKIIHSYCVGLEDIDSEELNFAIKGLMKTSKYFPRIADIISAVQVINKTFNKPIVELDDPLMEEYQIECDSLHYDPDLFMVIAQKFEDAGRLDMAASIRAKSARMASIAIMEMVA